MEDAESEVSVGHSGRDTSRRQNVYKSRAEKRGQEGNRDARTLGSCLSAQCGSEAERVEEHWGLWGASDSTGRDLVRLDLRSFREGWGGKRRAPPTKSQHVKQGLADGCLMAIVGQTDASWTDGWMMDGRMDDGWKDG